MIKKYGMIAALLCLSFSGWAQCDGRYETEIFDKLEVTEVEYTDVYDWSFSNSGLDMDVYEPVGDIETNRPLIVFAHGGSFYVGDKSNPPVVALCEAFAKRGYVTASIQYRLTDVWELVDSLHMLQTVMNAIGDAKAAIRYFRKDAADNGNTFGIDPNQIYMGGYSAGAIMAVNLAFIDSEEELPDYLLAITESSGGIEGNSGNPGYSSEVKAVVSLAGAVYNPSFIDSDDEPIVSVHAEDDATVQYACGPALSQNNMVNLCGSGVVHEAADEEGVYNALHVFSSGGHAIPYSSIEEVSIPFISAFLYTTLDCYDATISLEESALDIAIYPNPAEDRVEIRSKDLVESVRLLDLMGRTIFEKDLGLKQFSLILPPVSGFHVLQLTTNKGLESHRLQLQ